MKLTITHRRLLMVLLVTVTVAAAIALMANLLGTHGWRWTEVLMLLLFACTTPWVALGCWNALIGFLILHGVRDWLVRVAPFAANLRHDTPITARIAVVMPVYNEDPQRVLQRLQAVANSLDATGEADRFEFFLLSDSRDENIAAEEQARFAKWQAQDRRPQRLHYRRRSDNSGRKAGNIWDFCEKWGARFDYMLVLDADSVMSGRAILRLARLLQSNPGIGILQTLVVGLPAATPFARIFQFGMRQGMRPYTVGSAWWQGDAGPYWGHNAMIRLAPFRIHCKLPRLPGKPPLGGDILSHDQVEAVLMQRAGFAVRVLPVEDGSYEDNPPTLLDFIQRDLRWCQGNLQYLHLLGRRGWPLLGRVQLTLAVLMYTAAPCWLGFLLLGLGQAVFTEPLLENELSAPSLGLFTGMMIMVFAPKIFGVLDLLLNPVRRAAYGGAGRIASSSLLEMLFSILLGPVVALAQTLFIAGLPFGKQIRWETQQRDAYTLDLGTALAGLWPQMLVGVMATLSLAGASPILLPWAAPVLIGLLLAIPMAWLTASPGWGRRLRQRRLCVMPEELMPPQELSALGLELAPVEPDTSAALAATLPAQLEVSRR